MKDYKATLTSNAGTFDSFRIDADNDNEAIEIALRWAAGRGHNYSMQLKDFGGDEVRYIACRHYK